jgi:hypothetical protein
MSVDRALVAALEEMVGADHVRTDRGDVEPYARDATPSCRVNCRHCSATRRRRIDSEPDDRNHSHGSGWTACLSVLQYRRAVLPQTRLRPVSVFRWLACGACRCTAPANSARGRAPDM